MKKARFIAVLLLVASVLIAALILRRTASGTTYNGKPIKEWALLAAGNDRKAIEVLKASGTNGVPELIRLLQVQDGVVKTRLWLLWTKTPVAIRRFLPTAKPPDGSGVRWAAARSLGVLGPSATNAILYLERAMHDSSHDVCMISAATLSRIGRQAVPVLTAALQDRRPALRRAAAYALADVGTDAQQAFPDLVRLLSDEDVSVRSAAAYSLQHVGTPGFPELLNVVEHGDAKARSAAIQTMMRYNTSLAGAVLTLAKTADSADPATRRICVEAISSMRVPSAATIQALKSALSDSEPQVRVAALKGLVTLGPRAAAAIPGLRANLEQESAEIRRLSAQALGLIGPPAKTCIPKLTSLLRDSDPTVRDASKVALGRIDPG